MRSEKAHAAIQQKWSRLRSRGSWDESNPREWADIAKEAREQGREVHLGLSFGVVVEKNTDRPQGDPRRKCKGRVASKETMVRTGMGTRGVRCPWMLPFLNGSGEVGGRV